MDADTNPQGDDWLRERCGSLGASQVAEALAKTKSGWGAGRANVMAQLICERLTGEPTESYVTAAMQRGKDLEPQARAAYEFICDQEVALVGMVRHPSIPGTHASPDGLIGGDGLLEIKVPNSATHIETLLTGKGAQSYLKQMQWQMACAGRKWVDFVSFDPRLPADLQFWRKRIERDEAVIQKMESDVREFLAELDAKIESLTELRRTT
jgi:putative phage-type endonuclease